MMRCVFAVTLWIVFSIVSTLSSAQVPVTAAHSGSWYDPAESGQGLNIEVISETKMIVYFYTFDPAGNNLSLVGLGDINGTSVTIPLASTTGGFFPPKFDPSKIVRNNWGTLTLTFSDCTHGTASWIPTDSVALGYTSGSMPIVQIASVLDTVCGVPLAQNTNSPWRLAFKAIAFANADPAFLARMLRKPAAD